MRKYIYAVLVSQCFISSITYAESLSQQLEDIGVDPLLNASFIHLENPSLGQKTGQSENVYVIGYGAKIDLSKTLPVKDLDINIDMAYVPNITNMTFGMTVGDSVFADPSPFIPYHNYLTQFTIKKAFLDKKISIEVGKSSPSLFFSKPICNLLYSCQSPLLPSNPSLYPSWSAMVNYDLGDGFSLGAGGWNYIPEFPFQHGWETNEENTGRTYMASLFYNNKDSRANVGEIGVFRREAPENNPYTGEENSGYSGLYANRRFQISDTIDLGSTFKIPQISLFEQFTYSFDKGNAKGLLYTNTMGLTFGSFINSRPMDSYSLTLKNYQLTNDKQKQLVENYARNGLDYDVGRMQTVLQLDANFFFSPKVIFSPYIVYSWDTNTKNSYDFSKLPSDGVGFGLMGIIFLDRFFK